MPPVIVDFSRFPHVPGVRLGTASAGISQTERDDIALMEIAEGATVAAVFTQNAFCAAPVTLARAHLDEHIPRYLLFNSGNANAGTGQAGLDAARHTCGVVARLGNCSPEEVLPYSTGVIGVDLPLDRFETALPQAFGALDEKGWEEAATAIRTTDTVSKGAWRQVEIAGQTVTVAGIAKGAGMIRPNMATMLACVATDAVVKPKLLRRCLEEAVSVSFNRITVDGDTSTNDACTLVATGKSEVAVESSADIEIFTRALIDVCAELARQLIHDAEGATKFITIEVNGGRVIEECEQVAFTVAHSPLVKTAFFASDANWGRILAAVGRAGLKDLVVDDIDIFLGDVCIVHQGGRAPDYSEEAGSRVMAEDAIRVRIELKRGDASATVWTSDLSHEYIRINAEYRT